MVRYGLIKRLFWIGLWVGLVLFFSERVRACDNRPVPSPWFSRVFVIDEETLPSTWVAFQDGEFPLLKYIGDGEGYLLAEKYKSDGDFVGFPKGYQPVYRFVGSRVEYYVAYKDEWELEKKENVGVYTEFFEGKIEQSPGWGFGRPEHLAVPGDVELRMKLQEDGEIYDVVVWEKFSVNPEYDPYLQDRPDVLCGSRLGLLAYMYTMPLNLFDKPSTTIEILAYDLVHFDLAAYVLGGVVVWGGVYGVRRVVRGRKKKR